MTRPPKEKPSQTEINAIRARLVALGMTAAEAAQIAVASRTRREIADALAERLRNAPAL